MRRLHELDWPEARALALGSSGVRESAAAGTASRSLAMSIVRRDVEPGGPSHAISQSVGRRFRGKSDHTLLRMPRERASKLSILGEAFLLALLAQQNIRRARSRSLHTIW